MTSATTYKLIPIESVILFLDILMRFKLTFPNIYWAVERTGRTFFTECGRNKNNNGQKAASMFWCECE